MILRSLILRSLLFVLLALPLTSLAQVPSVYPTLCPRDSGVAARSGNRPVSYPAFRGHRSVAFQTIA